MNNIKVLSSNSQGNAVLYRDKVLVDCGISFKLLNENIDNVHMIFLTHIHTDHLNIKTLKKINGNIKIFCPIWLYDILIKNDIKNVTKIKMNKLYEYKGIKFSAFNLYHNVDNCGYRIFDNGFKIFHATDTAHLEGIHAKDYNLYAIEHNYDASTIEQVIDEKLEKHIYCYELFAVENHMSFQTASKWIKENASKSSIIKMLHISSRYYENKELKLPDYLSNIYKEMSDE